MRKLLFGTLTLLVLLFVATPGTVQAHTQQCYGGATSGGLCLIACDAQHRLFPGPHSCTYHPTYVCVGNVICSSLV